MQQFDIQLCNITEIEQFVTIACTKDYAIYITDDKNNVVISGKALLAVIAITSKENVELVCSIDTDDENAIDRFRSELYCSGIEISDIKNETL